MQRIIDSQNDFRVREIWENTNKFTNKLHAQPADRQYVFSRFGHRDFMGWNRIKLVLDKFQGNPLAQNQQATKSSSELIDSIKCSKDMLVKKTIVLQIK